MYLYTNIDGNMFRRVRHHIDYTGNLIGSDYFLVSDKQVHFETTKNQEYAKVIFNPPLMKTKIGGTLLNDFNSRIKRVVVNLLNEDIQGVKKVHLNGTPINNLSANVKDTFSIYKAETSRPVLDGYELMFQTRKNDKHIEIKMVSIMVDIQGG